MDCQFQISQADVGSSARQFALEGTYRRCLIEVYHMVLILATDTTLDLGPELLIVRVAELDLSDIHYT